MYGLTDMQQRCKYAIAAGIEERGRAPTYSALRLALGLKSNSGVYRLIHALEERGHIRCLRGRDGKLRTRAIEVIDVASTCPHCGEPLGSPACRAKAEASITYSNTPASKAASTTAAVSPSHRRKAAAVGISDAGRT